MSTPRDSAPDPAPTESVALKLPAHRRQRLEDPPRTAVLGGGPLGLEAALYAKQLGHSVWLFEREAEIAPDVRAWAHVSMFTAWADNRSPLGEKLLREAVRKQQVAVRKFPPSRLYPSGGEFFALYLEPLAFLLGESVLLETRVAAIGRSFMFPDEHADDPQKRAGRRFRLLTRSPREERVYTADYVIDATGITHSPRWVGAGGLPALGELGSFRSMFHSVPDVKGRDRIHFLGKKTLLVGDGPSAATSLVDLLEVASMEPFGSVLWATKSRAEMPLPLVPHDPLTRRDTLMKKVNLLIKNGHPRLQYSPVTQVEAVQHSLANNKFHVTLQVNHETQRLSVDSVVAAVGYRPDAPTYERVLHPEEPGIFAIGARAPGAGDFFLTQGRTQIRDLFRVITGQPDQDLYAEAAAALEAAPDFSP